VVNIVRDGIFLSAALTFALFAMPFFSAPASGFERYLNPSPCPTKSCALIGRGSKTPPTWIPVQASIDHPGNDALGKWRLVRTPGPEKEGDVVSIMRTADALPSDPEFAGLVIRCRAKSALQIAFVLITPFPPRTHPKITVTINHASMQFSGEVIPPGVTLALPDEAEVLAKGPWQSAKELDVEIEGEGNKIHGIVSLESLSAALAHLQANCASQ
jgi:hypothetical protein